MFLFYLVIFLSVLYTSSGNSCNGTAKYKLTFTAEWTSRSHNDFPPGPHFSPLVGCSHKSTYVMWAPGIKATTGVKNVAEFGGTSQLNNEMDQQKALNRVFERYQGRGVGSGEGTSSIPDIEVNAEYPLVSFITMIAPSPDWFVGVHDWDLCDRVTGEWRESRTRDLFPYDAGTDSGLRFTSGDDATNPPENIFLITKDTPGSLQGDTPINRFGTFTFVKTFDSKPTEKTNLVTKMPTSRIPQGSSTSPTSITTEGERETTSKTQQATTSSVTPRSKSSQEESSTPTITSTSLPKVEEETVISSTPSSSGTAANPPKPSSKASPNTVVTEVETSPTTPFTTAGAASSRMKISYISMFLAMTIVKLFL